MKTIKAKENHVFVRIHDNFRMSDTIHLGYDFSTGIKREDKPEYYREEPMTEAELKAQEELNA